MVLISGKTTGLQSHVLSADIQIIPVGYPLCLCSLGGGQSAPHQYRQPKHHVVGQKLMWRILPSSLPPAQGWKRMLNPLIETLRCPYYSLQQQENGPAARSETNALHGRLPATSASRFTTSISPAIRSECVTGTAPGRKRARKPHHPRIDTHHKTCGLDRVGRER